MKPIVDVAVTGAAGNIGYALVFRIASGVMLGEDQPIRLRLIEIPAMMSNVEGVVMELLDCAFPLLQGVEISDEPDVGFLGATHVLLVGSRPRGPGMERKDLLEANGAIFSKQGRALNEHASRDVKVLVVGNPANTNCLIAQSNAPDLRPEQFSAMTRLDHNRALGLLAKKTGERVAGIKGITIWGNHSSTQVPDISNAVVDGTPAAMLVSEEWVERAFIPTVQQRGAAIIAARGSSSAASAAAAAVDHMRDWTSGTTAGDWVSMAIPSRGDYGVGEGVVYSFPVRIDGGVVSVVEGLSLPGTVVARMKTSERELREERAAVEALL